MPNFESIINFLLEYFPDEQCCIESYFTNLTISITVITVIIIRSAGSLLLTLH